MVRLCQNRPEGFGPHSALHPSLPTTCFLDVVVEPLPTWIFLLVILMLVPLRIRAWRGQLSPSSKRFAVRQSPGGQRAPILSRVLSSLYYILIVALIAMLSLEIARLAVAELGIGLLPFTYVGIILAVLNRATWKSRTARLANVLFWTMLTIVVGLKTAAEQKEQDSPAQRVKDSSIQGKYPTSDEVLDNAVMAGVQAVLAALEFNGWQTLSEY